MTKTAVQPILSCAGRESVAIDATLLNELLSKHQPDMIGIIEKSRQLRDKFQLILNGEYDADVNGPLEQFKSIITTEFLGIQLIEAVNLARTASAGAVSQTALAE